MASSSNDVSTQPKVGDLALQKNHTTGLKHKQEPSESCTICLQPITERAVAYPCNHLAFDFICLAQWLQNNITCPLCKTDVTEVHYDWRSADDFKTYNVPQLAKDSAKASSAHSSSSRRRRRHPVAPVEPSDPSLSRRRLIYQHQLFSAHVGSNKHSGYQHFTPSAFSTSPHQQSRARAFLRRELRVFPHLKPRRRDYLIDFIVAVLKVHEPKSAGGEAEDLVAEFVGRKNAKLVLHELEAWLQSPFERLAEWDEEAQYAGEVGGGENGKGRAEAGGFSGSVM